MTRVDFYQLSRDPAELAAAQLAGKALASGAQVLVVAGDAGLRQAVSDALWAQGSLEKPAFLAHGLAGEAHADRQPILLADTCEAANGATIAVLADGVWREEAAAFARVLLLFGPDQTEAARELWRGFTDRAAIARHIFKQEGGGWREGG